MNKHSFTHSLVKGKDIHMATFINKLFPKTVDNQFLGNQFSLYIFYIITLITLWRSQHHMFSTDGGAQSIASIPLNHFSVDGATTVVGVFALWGLSQLIIGFIYLVIAIRYKSLIPFMYLLMFFEYLMRAIYIGHFKPVITLDTAPGAIANYIFIVITPILFYFSISKSKQNELK